MYFCIRDDDTSFFTSADELENAYGQMSQWGPVSLAVIPFCRAGMSKGVPEKFRGRWSTHPLHENAELVSYLRQRVSEGRFEIMLHGYHHDEPDNQFEFAHGDHLPERVSTGKKYLEDLINTRIRVFVAPRNSIGREGLNALAAESLHLAGVTGVSSGWPLLSRKTWQLWLKLRKWRKSGGVGVPWVLDLLDHREMAGTPVTPVSEFQLNQRRFELALKLGGVFCLATHYWELRVASVYPGEPFVGDQLRFFADRARSDSQIVWRSVGEIMREGPAI